MRFFFLGFFSALNITLVLAPIARENFVARTYDRETAAVAFVFLPPRQRSSGPIDRGSYSRVFIFHRSDDPTTGLPFSPPWDSIHVCLVGGESEGGGEV